MVILDPSLEVSGLLSFWDMFAKNEELSDWVPHSEKQVVLP